MGFRIFQEKRLDGILASILASMQSAIADQSPDYIVNVNEEDYINHLTSSFSLEPLVIHFDRAEASSQERYVPVRDSFSSTEGQQYRKQVITYHIPFSGDEGLLKLQPNTSISWSEDVDIMSPNSFCFHIVDYQNDADQVRTTFEQIKSRIEIQCGHSTRQVESFNNGLRDRIRQKFNERKQQLLAQSQVLTSLGVPIRKSKNVPATFTVPSIRKKVVEKPSASPSAAGAPVPTIDQAVYEDILQTIFEMGITFEKYPSTYAGKDEGALRDHLILQLEPRFEGSTTGETFNKTGKTDILIKYESSNIFVAECKFWDGKATHLKTIDQLLSYLTWRDSKTAIVYFVRRKEIVPVLETIEATTSSHSCYVRSLGKKNASWQQFEFHLPGDPACTIYMTILGFHIPGP